MKEKKKEGEEDEGNREKTGMRFPTIFFKKKFRF
jgi:hypothetical protein